MDQDGSWHGGGPRSRPHCLRWDPAPPQKKGTATSFRPMSVVAKWLDGLRCHWTGYGGGPRPRRLFVRWAAPSRIKGTAPTQFLVHVCCGQMAGWTKMPLGMEVGLSPGHIVLDGDPAPPSQKGHSSPPSLFGPCLLWPWSPISATAELLLWSPYGIFSSCRLFFFLFLSSPNLSGCRFDVYHTSTHVVALVRI